MPFHATKTARNVSLKIAGQEHKNAVARSVVENACAKYTVLSIDHDNHLNRSYVHPTPGTPDSPTNLPHFLLFSSYLFEKSSGDLKKRPMFLRDSWVPSGRELKESILVDACDRFIPKQTKETNLVPRATEAIPKLPWLCCLLHGSWSPSMWSSQMSQMTVALERRDNEGWSYVPRCFFWDHRDFGYFQVRKSVMDITRAFSFTTIVITDFSKTSPRLALER